MRFLPFFASKPIEPTAAGPLPAFYNRGVLRQRTLRSQTRAIGVGLHSGQRVELTLRPAPPHTGIVFRRIDLPQPVEIPMTADAVSDPAWPRQPRTARPRSPPSNT